MTESESLECDLLVLGAGMAGLSAAGFAAECGAKVIVIDGAGHFPHWEQPEEFVEKLSAFAR